MPKGPLSLKPRSQPPNPRAGIKICVKLLCTEAAKSYMRGKKKGGGWVLNTNLYPEETTSCTQVSKISQQQTVKKNSRSFPTDNSGSTPLLQRGLRTWLGGFENPKLVRKGIDCFFPQTWMSGKNERTTLSHGTQLTHFFLMGKRLRLSPITLLTPQDSPKRCVYFQMSPVSIVSYRQVQSTSISARDSFAAKTDR